MAVLATSKPTGVSVKQTLMCLLLSIRVAFSRYLVLYRWTQAILLRPGGPGLVLNVPNQTLSVDLWWRQFSPLLRKMQFSFPVGSRPHPRSEIAGPTPGNNFVTDCPPSPMTVVAASGRGVRFAVPGEYILDLRFTPRKGFRLEGFSILCPLVPSVSFLKSCGRSLSWMISKSPFPLKNSHEFLHECYFRHLFCLAVQRFMRLRLSHGFDFVSTKVKASITFWAVAAPYNLFSLVCTRFNLSLFSNVPLIHPHPGVVHGQLTESRRFLSFKVPIEICEIAGLLHELKECGRYTRLLEFWNCIVAGLLSVPRGLIEGNFWRSKIELFAYGHLVARIKLDELSGKPEAMDFGGLGFSPSAFCEAVEGCAYERDGAFQAILACSFTKLVFASAMGLNLDMNPTLPSLLHFSYAPGISVILVRDADTGAPRLYVPASGEIAPLSTHNIFSIQKDSLKEFTKFIASWKVTIVLMSLNRMLEGRQVPRCIENNSIRFSYSPFDYICFKLTTNFDWKLFFVGGISLKTRQLTICGRQMSFRFVDCVLRLVLIIGDFMRMSQQILAFPAITSKVLEWNDINQFSFRCEVDCSEPILLNLFIGPLSWQQSDCYEVVTASVPRFQFDFGYENIYHRLANHFIKEASFHPDFGPFLNWSFFPFYRLYSIFLKGRCGMEWSITGTRTDLPFSLVYRKLYSLHLYLKTRETFQLVVPSIGRTAILSIALYAFAQVPCSPNPNCCVFQVSTECLSYLKTIVEFFMTAKEGLEEIGFTDFRMMNGRFVCSKAKINGSLVVNCQLEPYQLSFWAIGDDETVQVMEAVLNMPSSCIRDQLYGVRLVAALVDFDIGFIHLALRFAAELRNINPAMELDWRQSLAKTSVQIRKRKVSFRLIFARGSARVELMHMSGMARSRIVAWNQSGVMTRLGSLELLLEWVNHL
jgi:hypothetical protein